VRTLWEARGSVTVEQSKVIDFVNRTPTGDVVLAISDHLPWSDVDDHLLQLQEKLNAYLRFIESGEVYEKFPETRERRLVIEVFLKFPVPQAAQWFFTKSAAVIEKAGFGFGICQISD
jgi:hypothetical protein